MDNLQTINEETAIESVATLSTPAATPAPSGPTKRVIKVNDVRVNKATGGKILDAEGNETGGIRYTLYQNGSLFCIYNSQEAEPIEEVKAKFLNKRVIATLRTIPATKTRAAFQQYYFLEIFGKESLKDSIRSNFDFLEQVEQERILLSVKNGTAKAELDALFEGIED